MLLQAYLLLLYAQQLPAASGKIVAKKSAYDGKFFFFFIKGLDLCISMRWPVIVYCSVKGYQQEDSSKLIRREHAASGDPEEASFQSPFDLVQEHSYGRNYDAGEPLQIDYSKPDGPAPNSQSYIQRQVETPGEERDGQDEVEVDNGTSDNDPSVPKAQLRKPDGRELTGTVKSPQNTATSDDDLNPASMQNGQDSLVNANNQPSTRLQSQQRSSAVATQNNYTSRYRQKEYIRPSDSVSATRAQAAQYKRAVIPEQVSMLVYVIDCRRADVTIVVLYRLWLLCSETLNTISQKWIGQPRSVFEDTTFKSGFKIVKFLTRLQSISSSLLFVKQIPPITF